MPDRRSPFRCMRFWRCLADGILVTCFMGAIVFSVTYAAFVLKGDPRSGDILLRLWVGFLPLHWLIYTLFKPAAFLFNLIGLLVIGLPIVFRVTGWRLDRPVLSLVGYALTGLLGVVWIVWTWWLWYMLTHLT